MVLRSASFLRLQSELCLFFKTQGCIIMNLMELLIAESLETELDSSPAVSLISFVLLGTAFNLSDPVSFPTKWSHTRWLSTGNFSKNILLCVK